MTKRPNYYYSASNDAFYAVAFRKRYRSAGTWPADAVAVSDDAYHEYTQEPPEGCERGSSEEGLPVWVPLPEKPISELVGDLKARIEELRDRGLNDPGALVTDSQGRVWQADPRSISLILDRLVLFGALGATPDGFTWRDSFNDDHPASLHLLTEIVSLREQQQAKIWKLSWRLKAAADAVEKSEASDEEKRKQLAAIL